MGISENKGRTTITLPNGGPTGSARPLVWAHAELLTLLRSLSDRAVFDCPRDVQRRYL